MKPVFTYVPGRRPIELVASYDELRDYYPYCEMQTKRWFVENVKSDWTICDVGANIGYYSILFSQLCPKGTVHAFEPTSTIDLLEKNISYHSVQNVQTYQIALGARSGNYPDAIYRIWGQDPELRPYYFLTLDDAVKEFDLKRLDCIKIDVDSFDFDVLRGAERSLQKFNPWIVVELNHALDRRGQNAGQAIEWLLTRGYQEAVVLDYDNFVLRRQLRVRSLPPSEGLLIRFDHRPIFVQSRYQKGEIIRDFFGAVPRAHGTSKIDGSFDLPDGIHLEIGGPCWSYGMSFDRSMPTTGERVIIIEVEIEVTSGTVGLGCVEDDYSTYVGLEITVNSAPGKQIATITVENAELISALVFRRTDKFDTSTTTNISKICVFSGDAAGSDYQITALRHDLTSLSNADIKREAGLPARPSDAAVTINVIESHRIGRQLRLSQEFLPPFKIYHRPLSSFKMEFDDAPILRFIYQNTLPRRHLEFGTWQGFGTTLCAASCDAEIWTINLPDGERNAAGEMSYSARIGDIPHDLASQLGCTSTQRLQSDAGAMIGWMYRAAGFQSRIHQILADSRQWDTARFAAEFFDSILIDGGHTSDVVKNDTEKALPLLRPGELMMWHDFCPDAATITALPACKGVVTAIAENLENWRPLFREIFWIQPSFLLVGIKG